MAGGGDEVGQIAQGSESFPGSAERTDASLSEKEVVGCFVGFAPERSFAAVGRGWSGGGGGLGESRESE